MIPKSYLKKIENYYYKNCFCIILLDGYSCAGKTFLSKSLNKYFNQINIPSTIISKDLFLHERRYRDKFTKLNKKLINQNVLHYDNQKFDKFINEIFSFYSLTNKKNSFKKTLYSLYDRKSGIKNKKVNFFFKKKQIIIIEGLFLLHNYLLNNSNFKFFLTSSKKQITSRKIKRKNNTNSNLISEIENIHIPSMNNYIQSNILKFNEILKLKNNNVEIEKSFNVKFKNEFLNNYYDDFNLKKISSMIFDLSSSINNKIIKKFEPSSTNLNKNINKIIKSINNLYKNFYKVEIVYIKGFNNFVNYYPIPLLLKIIDKKNYTKIFINFEFFENKYSLNLRLFYHSFSLDFKFNDLKIDIFNKLFSSKNFLIKSNNKLNVITPSDLLIPSFVNNIKSKNIIYSGVEDKIFYFTSLLKKLQNNETLIIQRITLFEDILNFNNLFIDYGYFVTIIGNYIIVLNSKKKSLVNKFNKFHEDWYSLDKYVYNLDYKNHDIFINQERKDLRIFANKLFNLKLFDDYFRITKINKSEIINDLKVCLNSNQRLVRKRACQLIFYLYPNLKINLKNIFHDYFKFDESIDFEDYIDISPTIMSELFLWLSIRSNKSSILACNIYDLGKNGLDIYSHLENSSLNSIPIILQGSLNALGPQNNNKSQPAGYLKLNNGFDKLKDLSKINGLKIFLKTNKTPFFGLGIDHLSFKYDFPKGRADNFYANALNTGYLTHVTLDAGDLLYDIKNNIEIITDYYSYLLRNKKLSFIIDKEIILSGLDYPENLSENKISSIDDLYSIMLKLHEKFRLNDINEINTRPILFVGNLGTTHHGMDKMVPKIQYSTDWKNALKKNNFISAVLHGTTKTEPFYLKESSMGCHKINVAGDFLNMFINSLPKSIFKNFESKKDPKYILPQVRKKIDTLNIDDQSKVKKNMSILSQNFSSLINSPILTERDKSFFKYNFYSFNNFEIKEIFSKINKFSINSKKDFYKKNKEEQITKIHNLLTLDSKKLNNEYFYEINNEITNINLVQKNNIFKKCYLYFNYKIDFEKSIYPLILFDQIYNLGFKYLVFDLDAFSKLSDIKNMNKLFAKKKLKILFNISNLTFKFNLKLLEYLLIKNTKYLILNDEKNSKNNFNENYFNRDLYNLFLKSINLIKYYKSNTKIIVNLSNNTKINHDLFLSKGAYKIIT